MDNTEILAKSFAESMLNMFNQNPLAAETARLMVYFLAAATETDSDIAYKIAVGAIRAEQNAFMYKTYNMDAENYIDVVINDTEHDADWWANLSTDDFVDNVTSTVESNEA